MPPTPSACSECGQPVPADQSRCPWCGAARPGAWTRALTWMKGGDGGDWRVAVIMAVNVVYFVVSLLLTSRHEYSSNPLNFLSPDQRSLTLLGATGAVPVLSFGRYWTLVSANYLHGGLLHIFFNMMALRQIGPWVSAEFGPNRMFVIYTLSGVAGYLASCFAGVSYTIGASASVCGLIGALFFFGKNRGGKYGAAVSREVGGWLISLVIFGLIMPGINNWGHGAGVVGGVVLARILGYRGRETSFHRFLALICLLATVLTLIWGAFLAYVILFA